MRRHKGKIEGEKFIGDTNTNEVHDLDNEKSLCRIDEIFMNRHEVPFSSLAKANKQGFDNCPYCIGKVNESFIKINKKLAGIN